MEVRKRHSHKRDAIMDALCATTTHPSAEMLYNELRQSMPDLSLATIYRNLALFRSEGCARGVCFVNGEERFDADVSDHPHLVCEHCGRVVDLDSELVSLDTAAVEESCGASVTSADIVFYGKCADCKNVI
ncbi:MAG: transcriptional repressor [Oscillospiraceae bacterium]|nr:transcriptional repressor [Oscillospiraceae bacterium]